MLRLAPCLMESLKELVGLGGTGTRDSEGKQGWMSPSSDHTRGGRSNVTEGDGTCWGCTMSHPAQGQLLGSWD